MKIVTLRGTEPNTTYERFIVDKDSREEYFKDFDKRIIGDFQGLVHSRFSDDYKAKTSPLDWVLRTHGNPVWDLAKQSKQYFDNIWKAIDKYGTLYINSMGGYSLELDEYEVVHIKEHISNEYIYVDDSEWLVLENDYTLPCEVSEHFGDTKYSSITSLKSIMYSNKITEYITHFASRTIKPKVFVMTTASDLNQIEEGMKLLAYLNIKDVSIMLTVGKKEDLNYLLTSEIGKTMNINFVENIVC